MQFTEIFIIFVMSIALLIYIKNYYGEIDIIKSKVDDRKYVVQQYTDKDKAADLLAAINLDILKLIQHVKAKYPERADVQYLYENYNPNALSEGNLESGYTAYSINKGERVVLCIRQKDKSFVEKNVLMYVVIHELAHIMTHDEVGHTTKFWNNFKFLLEEAISIQLYTKMDFDKKPEDYCGIKITSSVI